MAPWRGVVQILALSASVVHGEADALTLPVAAAHSAVRPHVDPVTLSHFLQPHNPRRTPSPLEAFANSRVGRSAAWAVKAIAYGTLCDVVVVRYLLHRLLGRPVFGRVQAASAPVPATQPHDHGHGHGLEVQQLQNHGQGKEAAGKGGQSQPQALGMGLLALVLCAGVARCSAQRPQPQRVAAASPVASGGDRGRVSVAALPHGLVQRRTSVDGPRTSPKHVTFRSDPDWLADEQEVVKALAAATPASPSNEAANTQFFRICSEVPAGVDPQDLPGDAAEAEAALRRAEEEARRRRAEDEARRRSAEEEARKEAQRKLAEAMKVKALPVLTAASISQLKAIQKRGIVEVVTHSAEGRLQPKPAPGERIIITSRNEDIGKHGTILQPAEAGSWRVRMDDRSLLTLSAQNITMAPPPVATIVLKKEIDFKPVHHGDPITTVYSHPMEAKQVLDDLAEVLRIYDSVLVSIEGHTATPKEKMDDWSFRLAQSRADKIREALIRAGIDGDRLKPIGLPGHHGSGKHDMVMKVVSL